MPLIMTLLVRDEADVVERNIEYHLSRGVSHILATDNLSEDGTTEILLKYQRLGLLTYYRETANTHDQAKWVTRMAWEASSKFPSSIVFHVDADEFWWPEGDTLPLLLNAAFAGFHGIGQVSRVNYLGPNIDMPSDTFLDRCTYRQTKALNVLGKPLPGKVCHRATQKVLIDHGNHKACWVDGKAETRPIDQIEVLHFPNRSVDQFIEKTVRGAQAVRNNPDLPIGVCGTWLHMDRAIGSGEFPSKFQDQVLSESRVKSKVQRGEIIPCDKLSIYCAKLRLWQRCGTAVRQKLASRTGNG